MPTVEDVDFWESEGLLEEIVRDLDAATTGLSRVARLLGMGFAGTPIRDEEEWIRGFRKLNAAGKLEVALEFRRQLQWVSDAPVLRVMAPHHAAQLLYLVEHARRNDPDYAVAVDEALVGLRGDVGLRKRALQTQIKRLQKELEEVGMDETVLEQAHGEQRDG